MPKQLQRKMSNPRTAANQPQDFAGEVVEYLTYDALYYLDKLTSAVRDSNNGKLFKLFNKCMWISIIQALNDLRGPNPNPDQTWYQWMYAFLCLHNLNNNEMFDSTKQKHQEALLDLCHKLDLTVHVHNGGYVDGQQKVARQPIFSIGEGVNVIRVCYELNQNGGSAYHFTRIRSMVDEPIAPVITKSQIAAAAEEQKDVENLINEVNDLQNMYHWLLAKLHDGSITEDEMKDLKSLHIYEFSHKNNPYM